MRRFVLFFLLISSQLLDATEVVFPVQGATEVGTMDQIIIRTDFPIDTNSIDLGLTYLDDDSPIFIYDSYYEGRPDSLISLNSRRGIISLLTDNEILFQTMESFGRNRDVNIRINDLITIKPGNDTVIVDTVFKEHFRTIDNPPYVIGHNINNGSIKCNETIIIKLMGRLPSAVDPNNIIEFKSIDSLIVESYLDSVLVGADSAYIPIDSSTYVYHWHQYHPITTYITDINFSAYYDSVNKQIQVIPSSSLEGGKEYELGVKIGDVTGDTLNNYYLSFVRKDYCRVKVGTRSSNPENYSISEDILPSLGDKEWSLYENDSVFIHVPKIQDGYEFLRWKCEQDPSIDTISSNYFYLSKSCDELVDLEIFAEYFSPCVDTLTISFDSSAVALRVNGYQDSLGYNKFTYKKYLNSSLRIYPIAKSGNYISSILKDGLTWSDHEMIELITLDPCDDNNDTIPIQIGSNSNSMLNTCSDFTFCVTVHKDDIDAPFDFDDDLNNIIDILNVSQWTVTDDDYLTYCKTYENVDPEETITHTFRLELFSGAQDCYEITYYKIEDGEIKGTENGEPPIGSSLEVDLTLTNPSDNCEIELNVFLRRKYHKLYTDFFSESSNLPIDYQRYIDISKDDNIGIRENIEICRDESQKVQMVRYTYLYPCSTIAKHYPSIDNIDGQLYTLGDWQTISPDNDNYCLDQNLDINIYSTNSENPYPDYLSVMMDEDKRIIYEFLRKPFNLLEIHFQKPSPDWEQDINDRWTQYRTKQSESLLKVLPGTVKNVGLKTTVQSYLEDLGLYQIATLHVGTTQNLPTRHTHFSCWPNWTEEDMVKYSTYYEPSCSYPSMVNFWRTLGTINYHRNTTTVRFVFSEPVDLSSIENGAIQFVEEEDGNAGESNRPDLWPIQAYECHSGEFSNIEAFQNNTVIEVTLVTEPSFNSSTSEPYWRFWAPHMTRIMMNITDDIKRASDGQALANPLHKTRIVTENPKLYAYNWNVMHYEGGSGDNCLWGGFPDLGGHLFSEVLNGHLSTSELTWYKNNSEPQKSGAKFGVRDDLRDHTPIRGDNSARMQLFLSKHLTNLDYPMLGYHVYDEGNDTDVIGQVGNAAFKASDGVSKAVSGAIAGDNADFMETVIGSAAGAVAGGLIGAGLKLGIEALMKSDGCDDETLMEVSFLGIPENNWSPFPDRVYMLYGATRWSQDANYGSTTPWGYNTYQNDHGRVTFFWILGDF